MEKITIIGYKYNELPEEAQQKLKEKIVSSWEYMDDFHWEMQDVICNDFPNSDIKMQWGFSYCQGDGVNLYGTLDYRDAIEFIKKMQRDKFEENFTRIVKFCDIDFKLPENPNYAYCYASRADITEALFYEYEAITDEEPPEDWQAVAQRFKAVLIECLEDFCKEIEDYGYGYFNVNHIDNDYATNFYNDTIFTSSGIDINQVLR